MKVLAVLAAAAFVAPSTSAEHIASRDQIMSRLVATAHERTRSLDTIESVVQVQGLRPAAQLLSDAELADLAARAEALQADPVAGVSAKKIIVIAIIVLLVLAVVGRLGS